MYMKTKSKYQQELYKIGANIHDNGHGKSLMRLQLYAKNYKQLKTLKWKKYSAPRKNVPSDYPLTNSQPIKHTYMLCDVLFF